MAFFKGNCDADEQAENAVQKKKKKGYYMLTF